MKPLYLLCGNRSEQETKRLVAYLVKQFPMAKDSNLEARAATDADPDYLRNRWLGVIPDGERWSQYSSTIEKMRSAAQDYEAGWRDAIAETKLAFKADVQRLLGVSSSVWDMIKDDIERMEIEGFTVPEAVKYCKCREEVNPALDEATALKRMATIQSTVEKRTGNESVSKMNREKRGYVLYKCSCGKSFPDRTDGIIVVLCPYCGKSQLSKPRRQND